MESRAIVEKFIVFGTGEFANSITKQLSGNVSFYLDNDPNKMDKTYHDKPIFSPSILLEKSSISQRIIVASTYYKEISIQLEGFGLEENIDYYDARCLFIEEYNNEYTWLHECNKFKYKTSVMEQLGLRSILDTYLKNYEKINAEDYRITEFRKDIPISEISEEGLSELYRVQLDNHKATSFNEMKKRKNMHIIFDNMYSKAFYDSIQNKHYAEENIFVLVENYNTFHFFDHVNTNIYKISALALNKYCLDINLLHLINNADAIYIHYLTDEICEIFENQYIEKKKTYWIVWGGDLYSYLDIPLLQEKTTLSFSNMVSLDKLKDSPSRKLFISNLTGIFTAIYGDYSLVQENYETSAEYRYFIYPAVVDFSILDRIIAEPVESHEKINVLVGNSGTPSNNHLEVFEQLVNNLDEINEVIVPLSYGNDSYIKEICGYGETLLGDKFKPIFDFLDSYDYGKLIQGSDLVLMNHNRQQGVGNILISLYLGKTVMVSEKVTVFNTFRAWGFIISDIESFFNNDRKLKSFINIDAINTKNNQQLCTTYFREYETLYAQLFG